MVRSPHFCNGVVFNQDMKRIPSLILLCVALAGCTDEFTRDQRASAEEIEGLIHQSGTVTIYSLEPQRSNESSQDEFHEYDIIGSKEVTNTSDRTELLTKLAESIQRGPDSIVAACFNPRHGLRFEAEGKQMDFVICFECCSARGYGTTNGSFLVTGSASAAFNTFLDKHQIQRSKRQDR